MGRRASFFGVFLTLVVVIAVAHLAVHFYFYGTGIKGFAEAGISGFVSDDSETNDSSSGFPLSKGIIIFEWALILLGIVFVYAKHKVDLKKELHELKIVKSKKRFSRGTEIDKFYELLQDVKHFRLSTAAQLFDVDEDIVEDWAKILEDGNLATLAYPRMGSPEIVLKAQKLKRILS